MFRFFKILFGAFLLLIPFSAKVFPALNITTTPLINVIAFLLGLRLILGRFVGVLAIILGVLIGIASAFFLVIPILGFFGAIAGWTMAAIIVGLGILMLIIPF